MHIKMSDYQNTTFALVKIRELNLSYDKLIELFNLTDDDELEIREDPYSKKRGEFYLFCELNKIPKNAYEMLILEEAFDNYKEFTLKETFEIKTINWYNGADMPLFED